MNFIKEDMLKCKQKAIVIYNDKRGDGIEKLNIYFEEGYLLKDKQFMPEEDDVYASTIFILEKNEII